MWNMEAGRIGTGISGWLGSFGRLTVRVSRTARALRPHVHPELNLLINCGGASLIMQVGDHVHNLNAGHAMFINRWQLHTPVSGGSSDRVLLSFYFDQRWFLDLCVGCAFSLTPGGFACVPFGIDVRTLSRATVLAYGQIAAMPIEAMERTVQDICGATLAAYKSQCDHTPTAASFVGPHVRRALECIHTQPTLPLDACVLARKVGLSRSHLFRSFKEQLGCTPAAIANALRMEFSIRALGGQTAQVAEISDALGFSTPGHFVNFFSAHMGVAPGRYRQRLSLTSPVSTETFA